MTAGLPFFFPAMTGLIQEYMFKENLRNCELIDLSRFVVDLRERHLEFWTPYSDPYSDKSTAAKFSLITDGEHCPQKRLWLLVLFLQPSQVHIPRPPTRCHWQCCPFRLRVHTLCFETATWNSRSSPTCDLCEADNDVQDG
jgi:hypothetical protein